MVTTFEDAKLFQEKLLCVGYHPRRLQIETFVCDILTKIGRKKSNGKSDNKLDGKNGRNRTKNRTEKSDGESGRNVSQGPTAGQAGG